MKAALIAVVLPFMGTLAYIPNGKEGLLSGMLLRGWLNSIKNKGADVSYLDLSDGLPLDTRAMNRDLEEEQLFSLDYDGLGDTNMYPSIRDQEYLQHSTLWGNQYISGGAGDGNQILGPGLKISQQEIKTDASLPAYCNPPNPCPVEYTDIQDDSMTMGQPKAGHGTRQMPTIGESMPHPKVDGFGYTYTEDQGCLENFENTAAFSRNYQGLQDCMCDTEHMFDCPSATNPMIEDPIEVARVDLSRLFHQSLKRVKSNPFLTGEKLPVAAKKGNNMY